MTRIVLPLGFVIWEIVIAVPATIDALLIELALVIDVTAALAVPSAVSLTAAFDVSKGVADSAVPVVVRHVPVHV